MTTVKITVDLPLALREKVKRKAKKTGTTTTAIVQQLLKGWAK